MININKIVSGVINITLPQQASTPSYTTVTYENDAVRYFDIQGEATESSFNISNASETAPRSPTTRAGSAESAQWQISHIVSIQGGTGITSIGNWCFSSFRALRNASFPNVTTVGIFAFSDNDQGLDIETVSLPKATSIGENAFKYAQSLTTLVLSSTLLAAYESNKSTWGIDEELEITVTDQDTPSQGSGQGSGQGSEQGSGQGSGQIGDSPFLYDSNGYITGLVPDESVNDVERNVEGMGPDPIDVWYLKSANKAVYDEHALGIADAEFGENGPSPSAPFMDGWNMMVDIGPSKSPTSVSLPNATYIGEAALAYCANLVSVNLPSVTCIGQQAFSDDSALTSISLPSSIESVGFNAFMNCTNLTSVTIAKTMAQVEAMNYENWSLGMVIEYDYEKYGDNWGHLVFDHEVTIHCTDGDIVVEEPAPPIEVEPETPDAP